MPYSDHMQELCSKTSYTPSKERFLETILEIMNEEPKRQNVPTINKRFTQRMQQSKEARNKQECILRIGTQEYSNQDERAAAYQALANMPRPLQKGDYLITGTRCNQDASLSSKPSIHMISSETKAIGAYETLASSLSSNNSNKRNDRQIQY